MEDKNSNAVLCLIIPILALGIFLILNYHQCSLCGVYGFFYHPHTILGETYYLCDNCEPYLYLLSMFTLFI